MNFVSDHTLRVARDGHPVLGLWGWGRGWRPVVDDVPLEDGSGVICFGYFGAILIAPSIRTVSPFM